MHPLCPLSLCRSLAGGFRGGRATLLAGLVPLAAVLAAACGGDDDGDPPGAMVDGGIQTDAAAPGDVDAGADTPDAAPACGRELDPGEQLGAPVRAILDETYLYVVEEQGKVQGSAEGIRLWRFDRERGGAELLTSRSYPDPEDAVFVKYQLAADPDSIYVGWSSSGEQGLLRVPKNGDDAELISTDSVEGLAIDESHVYWSTGGELPELPAAIKRRAKAGGDEEILVQADVSFRTKIVVVGDDLLWNDPGEDLQRIPKAGGTPEEIGSLAPDGSGFTAAFVAGADGFLYWSSFGLDLSVFRSSLDGFQRELVATDEHSTGDGLVFVEGELFVVDGQIYWRTGSIARDEGIGTVSVEGGVPVNVYPDPVGFYAWVPSSNGLYVADDGSGARVIPLDGCPL